MKLSLGNITHKDNEKRDEFSRTNRTNAIQKMYILSASAFTQKLWEMLEDKYRL